MLPGIEHFRTAHDYLAARNIGQAAQFAWKAMFHASTWPDQLQQHANGLIPLLFRHGPIDTTVKRLSAEDQEALRLHLLSVVEEALAADGIESNKV